MKKRLYWIRITLQVLLIAAALLILFVLKQKIADAAVLPTINKMIAAVTVCFFALLAVNVWIGKNMASRLLNEHDEKVARLTTKAQTDSLTGLLNREAAISQITQFLEGVGKKYRHALLIVDLDNFKMINDNFGHFQGDKVLTALSGKLKSVFRSMDIVGRLGGDEYIVLLKHTDTNTIIKRKVLELRSVLEYIYIGGDISVTITGSIGISVYDGDGKNFERLYKEADEALYRAKLEGKNKFLFFKSEDNEEYLDGDGLPVLTESSASIQLQAVMENIDGGIVLLEIGTEIRAIFLSRSFVRHMKLSHLVIKQADNRIFDFVNKDDAVQIEEALKKSTETGAAVDSVFRFTSASGRTEWHHMRAVRIPYENSDLPVMIAIITDVTNLKETELNYFAQKKQLETVLKLSNVITFEVDIERRTLYVGNTTVSKYGIDTYAIENMPDVLIDGGAIHPDSIEECRRMYNEIYAGVPEGSATIKTMKRSGKYTIERFTYFTVFDAAGRPVKAVGVAEGTETRSNALLRVELTEKLFRKYADNFLSLVKVKLSTDAFEFLKNERLPGKTAEKVKTYTDLLAYKCSAVSPADRQRIAEEYSIASLQKYFDDGRVLITNDFKGVKSNGDMEWINISANLFLNPVDGELIAYIRTRNISERKKLELKMPFKIERNPSLFMYAMQSLRGMMNVTIGEKNSAKPCAIVLLTVERFEGMNKMYGEQTVNDLIEGIAAKVNLVIETRHPASYAGNGVFVILIPESHGVEWFEQLLKRIIKALRDPAMFLYHEEDLMQYRTGYAIAHGGTAGFDDLYAEAMKTLKA